MTRPVTLFTGQWADVPLAELAAKAAGWGYDGLELACSGDHFDVDRALAEAGYVESRRQLLDRHGLACHAISIHLVGQCVCDLIGERHRDILPPAVWGDGDAEGVRVRAASKVADAARAAALLGAEIVTGFTGSSIWHFLYAFPPTPAEMIDAGYRDFAARWNPIIDIFDEVGVRFALEVHPTEIAYDFITTARALEAIERRGGFGLNFDPSHLVPQFLDPGAFVEEFADRIYHVHVKDARRSLDGRRSVLGSHVGFGHRDRGWDFVSPGRGDVDFEGVLRALNRIGYTGPLSVEWEDSGMDREWGAREALEYVRRRDFPASSEAFDAAFRVSET